MIGQLSKERLIALQVEGWDVNQMAIKRGRTHPPPPPPMEGDRKKEREKKYGLEVVTLVWNHSLVSLRRHKQESLSCLTLFLGRIKAICPFFVLDPNCIFLKPKVLAHTFISTNKLQWAQKLVIEAVFKPLQLLLFFSFHKEIYNHFI